MAIFNSYVSLPEGIRRMTILFSKSINHETTGVVKCAFKLGFIPDPIRTRLDPFGLYKTWEHWGLWFTSFPTCSDFFPGKGV